MKNAPWLIEFRNVTIQRGPLRALDSISLAIPVGQHVAIIGPNGSGKSTFIKALTRECYPRQIPGSALRILGEEYWDVSDLRRHLGIVSNDLQYRFSRDITGREAILSGFFSSVGLWPAHRVTPAMEKKSRQVMKLLGVAGLADRPMDAMSSGEARRFLIGRALVHDPKALVLDEPTTSLDFRAADEFRKTLRNIARAGKGIILVTHQIEDVIPEIERIILLKKGRIFADGPKDRMLTGKTLSVLFEMNLRLRKKPA